MPTLLITGSNRGIGLELVKQYLRQGWEVHASCRSPNNAHELNLLTTDETHLHVHRLNVTDETQLGVLKQTLDDTPIDVLINNAGVYGQWDSQFGNCDTDAWLTALRINTIAPMRVMETFADNVAASRLRIIASISSKMGSMADNGSGGSYVYRSTKAALNAVMVSAAHDLAPRGIIAVTLHPGWVRTDMGGPNALITAEQSARNMRKILDNITRDDAGRFYDINGTIIPW